MAFVSDSFTDTNNTNLSSHTGETGASWTLISSQEAQIISNRLECISTNEAEYYASGVPASADYDVEMDVVVDSVDNANVGVLGRVEVGGQNDFYLADWNNGTWRLFKRINTSFTALGTYADSFTGTKALKLEIVDATKKVYVDSVERISSSDNAITAAGRAGVRVDSAIPLNAGDVNGDNFTATDTGGGGATNPKGVFGLALDGPFRRAVI